MLKTFKSSVGPDVMMFGEVADQLLEIMGKPKGAQGIVTIEEMSDVISRLKQAVDGSRRDAEAGAVRDRPSDSESDSEGDRQPSISLAQRAKPLIELLQRSQQANKPVVWGV